MGSIFVQHWCLYQSMTNIFEYSNILVTNIYSDIRSYQFFFYEYIRTFVRVKFACTDIFKHSLVSVKPRRIFEYSCNFQYEYLFGHSFVSKKLVWIYSDIHSCNFVDTNIFGHSFVSKFSRMSHSGTEHRLNTVSSVMLSSYQY